MQTLGQTISNLRRKYNVGAQEIADIIGVKTVRSIQYIEAGERNLNHHQLEKLAKFFNVTTDYLLGLSNSLSNELPPDLFELVKIGKLLSSEQRKILIQLAHNLTQTEKERADENSG